jgi:hypothetical protein
MITPSEFVERWKKAAAEAVKRSPALPVEDYALLQPRREAVEAFKLPPEAKRFLLEAGLPKSAAPCLSLDQLAAGKHRIWEIWGSPKDWAEPARQRLAPYCQIGSDDDSGNPICLDEARGGQVWLLEHEDDFRSLEFMNSSVPQLAEFLLLYEQFVGKIQSEHGEDAFLEGRFPAGSLDLLRNELQAADEPALGKRTFWSRELASLRANDAERKSGWFGRIRRLFG